MGLDEMLIELIKGAPNLIFAAVALYWVTQKHDDMVKRYDALVQRLLQENSKLTDKILSMVDDVKEVDRVVLAPQGVPRATQSNSPAV